MTDTPAVQPTEEATHSTERFKAFADAVVAIAMTLLILPLMESVSDAAGEGLSTLDFLSEHGTQLGSFILSFALIANFWLIHHRLYANVERISRRLLTLNLAWMLTIVWLPVPTAMVGQAKSDALQAVLYVGTLMLTCALTLLMRVYLLRHPSLIDSGRDPLISGIAVDIAMLLCFGVTLIFAVAFPGTGYFAFFICMLIGPLQSWIHPWLARRLPSGPAQDPVASGE